eukprot:jgi/Phyca11/19392/fgenesh1_pg.PHYCAscaffold_47_\
MMHKSTCCLTTEPKPMDIVTTSNFHATLLPGLVSVVFVPAEHIRHSSWPLLNFDDNEGGCVRTENHVCRSMQTEIFSIVSDKEGATLFMDPNGVNMFKRAGMEDLITVAPQSWRAIQIHLGPMVAEFPGVVSFLSKLLADEHISILNMSTYDTDVIFVQEMHLENAIACLQSKLSRGLHGLKEAKDAENALSDRESMSLTDAGEEAGALANASRVGDGQYLTVYPESLVLVRLQKDTLRATEEVSLIMDERCLTSFEEDSLIVSPDRWRAIKLSGRAYGFDETGVVAAMSGCSTDTQVLNVSCFASNVAFVLDDMLDDAIETLCSSLDISRVER